MSDDPGPFTEAHTLGCSRAVLDLLTLCAIAVVFVWALIH